MKYTDLSVKMLDWDNGEIVLENLYKIVVLLFGAAYAQQFYDDLGLY